MPAPRPVFTFTDFGPEGPYLAQLGIQVRRHAHGAEVHTLMSDAPMGDPRRAGYLLAALFDRLPPDAVVIAVVDPGVGGPRLPLAVAVEGRHLVGPDNGLLVPALRTAAGAQAAVIDWRPERLSSSFHGRDLFAPVAAFLASGTAFDSHAVPIDSLAGMAEPKALAEVIYLDRFGNAFTGLPADAIPVSTVVEVSGARLRHARTFSAAEPGALFWYQNSCGLLELAANGDSAAERLGIDIGTAVRLCDA